METTESPHIETPTSATSDWLLLSSVQARIFAGVGLLTIILLALVAGSAWLNREHNADLASLEANAALAQSLEGARYRTTLATLLLERYMASGNEQMAPVIRSSLLTAEDHLADAKALKLGLGIGPATALGGGELASLDDIQTQLQAFKVVSEQVIEKFQNGNTTDARVLFEDAALDTRKLGLELSAVVEAAGAEIPGLQSQADRTGVLAFWLLVVGGLAGALIGLVGSVFLARSIIRPLSSVEKLAQSVAAGDLSARTKPEGPREVAHLGASVNRMADSLVATLERSEKAYARLQRSEKALRESEEKFRTLAETAAAAIFIYQGEQIKYVNSAAEAITGYTRDEWQSMKFWDIIHPDFLDLVRERGMARQEGDDIPSRYQVKIMTKGGEERWVDFTAGQIEFEGEPAVLGTAFDITESRRAEERIAYLAYHDALTNLPNRTLFEDRASVAFADARRSGHSIAIVSLDIDRLKMVNDTLGHPAGDELLQSAAQRLGGLIRQGDTLARTGGDEFVVMLTHCETASDGVQAAARMVEAFRDPFKIDRHDVHTTISAGVSFFPTDGDDLKSLMKNADAAMYRAKRNGRNDYQVYDETMNAGTNERLQMESDLRRALEREELVIHYQPQFSVDTGKIVGVEALVRWLHPEKGVVGPDDFIPLAEETGLVVPLGNWVLVNACQQAKDWTNRGFPAMRLAVNVSIRQFERPDFANTVARTLEQTGFDPQLLDLEVTEGTIMQDPEVTKSVLEELAATGIRIAIDDFGTGYSSLQHLRMFPIHVLKVDRTFVGDLPDDANDAAIAFSVIKLAHSLNLQVIAEGVETQEQLDFLREHGCDSFQGYLYSRPLPAQELERLLKGSARSAATTAEESNV